MPGSDLVPFPIRSRPPAKLAPARRFLAEARTSPAFLALKPPAGKSCNVAQPRSGRTSGATDHLKRLSPPGPHQSAFIEHYLPASSSLSEIRHPETPLLGEGVKSCPRAGCGRSTSPGSMQLILGPNSPALQLIPVPPSPIRSSGLASPS
jgi:hypothetical protein